MLLALLSAAGFFAIHWPPTRPGATGTTYVLPTARGVWRAFVPAGEEAVELYVGRLRAGELRYRGPLASAAALQHVLGRAAGAPI